MINMEDIRIKHEQINASLSKIKQYAEDLATSHSNLSFPASDLDFLNKILSIEDTYHQALEQYQTALLKTEADIQSNLETYANTIEDLVHQIES